MEEVWKQITEFPDYKISNMGRVMSYARYKDGKIMKQLLHTGYYRIGLYCNNKQHCLFVHRLLAQAFIPNPDNLPTVDHIDRNPVNNSINNLRWASVKTQNINRISYRTDITETDTKKRLSCRSRDLQRRNKENKKYYCKTCDKPFGSNRDLTRHETTSQTHLTKINSASK